MKHNEVGRSMIEMLGVLAIVGILSIGGIAGFSKAMDKYKFDKSLETYSMFIQNVMEYQKDWNRLYHTYYKNPNGQYFLINLITSAGLKPDNWTIIDDKRFKDEANGRHAIDARGDNMIEFQYGFDDKNKIQSKERDKRCVLVISNIIKPLENLYTITFWQGSTRFGDTIYGKKYCSKSVTCLDDLDFGLLYNQCTACARRNSSCGIVFVLK